MVSPTTAVWAPTACCGARPTLVSVGPHLALMCGGCGTNVGPERLDLRGFWIPKAVAAVLPPTPEEEDPCAFCGRLPTVTVVGVAEDPLCAACALRLGVWEVV